MPLSLEKKNRSKIIKNKSKQIKKIKTKYKPSERTPVFK